MKKISLNGLIAGLVVCAIIFGCNPQKKIIREPLKEKGADYLVGQLKKNEFHFKCLNIKFDAEVKYNKKSNSFSGNARIRKDSAIWLAIYPLLGIEAARIVITTDSIKLLNRVAQTYYCGSIKYINTLLGTTLDFDMLQSLLIGNDFSSYENDVFKASVDGKQYLLSTIGRRKLKKPLKNTNDTLMLMQDIWLDPDNFKIVKVHIKQMREMQKLDVAYSDFIKVDSLLFPKTIQYVAVNDKNKIEINIDNSKVTTNGTISFPFIVSDKYDRIKY